MTDDYRIYQDIEKRVELRFRRRRNFTFHVVVFVVGISLLWVMLAELVGGLISLIITLLWCGALFLHGFSLLFYEAQERALRQEIERERAWSYGEKRKNNPELYLSDDGELVEIPTEDRDAAPKTRKRG